MKSTTTTITLCAALAVLCLAPTAAADETTTKFVLKNTKIVPVYLQADPDMPPPVFALCANGSNHDITVTGSRAKLIDLEPRQCIIVSDKELSAQRGEENPKMIAEKAEAQRRALAWLDEKVADLVANSPLSETDQAVLDRFKMRRDEGASFDLRRQGMQPVILSVTPVWKDK